MNKYYEFDDEKLVKEDSDGNFKSIRCDVCGALASENLWNEYGGNCPICAERKKRKKRDARAKAEAEKKTKVEKKTEEVSEDEGLPLRVTFGFGAFVALLLGLIKKFRR